MQLAKYSNTTPWELAKQSDYWIDKTILAMSAEIEVNKVKAVM